MAIYATQRYGVVLLLSLMLILNACTQKLTREICAVADKPSWYVNKNIQKTYESDIIGYGCGPTDILAIVKAQEKIAGELGITVKAESVSDNQYFTSGSKVTIDAKLVGAQTVEEAVVRTRDNKMAYFAAVRYDNANVRTKVARDITNGPCRSEATLKLPYDEELRETAKINAKNNDCKYRWELDWAKLEQDKKVDRDGKWLTSAFKKLVNSWFMDNEEFRELFWPKDQTSGHLSMELMDKDRRSTKKVLYHKDTFFIRLKGSLEQNAKPKYLSLITIDYKGITTAHPSQLVDREFQMYLPDPYKIPGFVVAIDNKQVKARELYVAALCDNDISELIVKISKVLVTDSSDDSYSYGELLSSIEANRCHVATKQILIQRPQ